MGGEVLGVGALRLGLGGVPVAVSHASGRTTTDPSKRDITTAPLPCRLRPSGRHIATGLATLRLRVRSAEEINNHDIRHGQVVQRDQRVRVHRA